MQYSEEGLPERIDSIVVSTQHEILMKNPKCWQLLKTIYKNPYSKSIGSCSEKVRTLFDGDYKLFVNPTGKFVIGGPHGDSGLTGRKIIVDTYGGHGAHGGGAFSGKDPQKLIDLCLCSKTYC
jgi:S-adenosylmethionine synthetase